MVVAGGLFIGIGVGMMFDHVAAGTMIGLGVGLLLMPLESKFYRNRR